MLNHGASVNHERWEVERDRDGDKPKQKGKKASKKTTEELMRDFGDFSPVKMTPLVGDTNANS